MTTLTKVPASASTSPTYAPVLAPRHVQRTRAVRTDGGEVPARAKGIPQSAGGYPCSPSSWAARSACAPCRRCRTSRSSMADRPCGAMRCLVCARRVRSTTTSSRPGERARARLSCGGLHRQAPRLKPRHRPLLRHGRQARWPLDEGRSMADLSATDAADARPQLRLPRRLPRRA